jgi:hypothetical protein
MDQTELERLRRHYAGLTDDALAGALTYGPEGYATPEVWLIIEEEAARRGFASTPLAPAGAENESSGPASPTPPAPHLVPAFGDLPGDGIHYAVYVHPDGRRQAVKRGFSWPGFFLTWIWAFAKGLLDWGAGVLVASFVIMAIARSGKPVLVLLGLVGGVGLRLIVGSDGNAARERALLASHWQLLGTLPALTPEDALARAEAAVAGAANVDLEAAATV